MSTPVQRPPLAEIHRIARDRLSDREQRYTPGRRAVIETLAIAGGPLTLPELLERSPQVSQSSAYRNLAVMEDAGVVRRLVHGSDHAHYELAEGLTEHHHHLICEVCGSIADVTLDEPLEAVLDTAFAGVAAAAGFTPREHAIDIFGRCSHCAERAAQR